MYGFLIVAHTLVCVLLMAIILMQSGRGGGLTESFAPAESMFGAKTNVVLIRATAVLATVFLVTCLSLAFLSAKRNKSLISSSVMSQQEATAENAAAQTESPSADANNPTTPTKATIPEAAPQTAPETVPAGAAQ